MLIGDFKRWESDQYLLSTKLVEVLDYLRSLSFEQVDDGVYPVGEDGIYLIVKTAETFPFEEMRPEHHERYIDIHYMISGTEKIGFARANESNRPVEVVPLVEDHTFFDSVEQEIELLLYPGQYAVFMPSDLHRPWCSAYGTRSVRKALLKVPVSA
ncbi:YhcH/YjgK/YiaL family protein [Paenibacillus radicis (ex Xue et al. 2023)]|uniref:YhcH/YjgK/YiaL family protein n=1 Tax=Paenibacillus radicis (ex Xue et al. 2023) TaxID=2972489 RepID=A0ABT1YG20_9BACL|nr:YhcH/YjgK/YiaL family protein [Paenibacillus radicis (ex Xue et al. 2023)]MCR8631334.1 YhcH/YjgK/YiaL family protein [Paenibacillus radicis (ex Xue et al. 2023)]